MASLSKAEAARVARFPKSPLSKRFAVERASLREILSGLTGRRAAEIELSEDFGGRVQLASRQGQWSIAIAHVALWTVIGVSRSRIGLASVSADYRSGDMQQETDAWRTVRAHVRQSSLRDAGIEADVKDVSGALLDNEDASYRFDAPSDHRWHLVDLPMAGSNLLTLTAPYPMEQVHGFGWTSSSGYLLTR
ncbi:hypothetical protein [Caballeronia novacaledonica]|nr:hypothetical protein [Caballeronia novacaledonica]